MYYMYSQYPAYLQEKNGAPYFHCALSFSDKYVRDVLNALRLSHNRIAKLLEEMKSDTKRPVALRTIWKLTNIFSIEAVEIDDVSSYYVVCEMYNTIDPTLIATV